jgi:hypothetical protein
VNPIGENREAVPRGDRIPALARDGGSSGVAQQETDYAGVLNQVAKWLVIFSINSQNCSALMPINALTSDG